MLTLVIDQYNCLFPLLENALVSQQLLENKSRRLVIKPSKDVVEKHELLARVCGSG